MKMPGLNTNATQDTLLEPGVYKGQIVKISEKKQDRRGNTPINIQFSVDGDTRHVFGSITLEYAIGMQQYQEFLAALGITNPADMEASELYSKRIGLNVIHESYVDKNTGEDKVSVKVVNYYDHTFKLEWMNDNLEDDVNNNAPDDADDDIPF